MATVASMWVKVGADIRDLKKNLTEGQKVANDFARGMSRAGKRLTIAATLPILALGAASLKTAGDFEASMNRVQAVSGATALEFKSLQAQAAELGATTQYSASQAGDAMGFLAMAGFKTSQIMGAMPGTLQLAAAAQIDLGRAADIVTNILTGYGLAVEELGRANDVLVRTFTRTNVDMQMLGESFKYVGPLARGAGVEFEEAAAAIGLMGNAGIQGSMAGTSLRGAITRLLKPTSEVSSTLARLGITAVDSSGKLVSLTEIVDQLEKSGATTGDMMAIFGQRAGPAMAALVEQGSDALRNLVRELEGAGGTAQRIAETQMQGLRGAMRELKSGAEALVLAITGSGLLDGATALAKRFAALLRALAGLPPSVLRVATVIAGLVAVLGPLLLIGAKVIALFLKLKLLAAATGIAIGTIAAPVTAAVIALTALAAIFLMVSSNAKKSRDATKAAAEAAAEAARIEAQTPEGRFRQIARLEGKEAHLLRRLRTLRGAATTADTERKAKQFTKSANQVALQVIQTQARLGELRRMTDEVASGMSGAAAATAEFRRGLDLTADNFTRLLEAERKATEALGDLQFEKAFTPAGEALDEINKALEETEERLQAINREMVRFHAAAAAKVAALPTPNVDVAQSVTRGIRIPTQKVDAPTAVERAQASLDRWLADPKVTVEALADTAEFRQIVDILTKDRERRDAITKAAGGGEKKGLLESVMSAKSLGEAFGAVKTAVMASLKVIIPLILAIELIKGVMDAIGEPLQALLLPVRMLGETLGKALIPIIRALWPVLKSLTIAATYLLQAFFWVSGYLQKGIGWLLEAIGKAAKWLTFGLVKSIEKAGKGLGKMGDESLESAAEFGRLRGELQDMSFDDALDRVADSANKAADALLNVPTGFKVALARFRSTTPAATYTMPSSASAPAPAGTTSVQNEVTVTINVQADDGTNISRLVQEIKRELVRDAQRGGATGIELVFAT